MLIGILDKATVNILLIKCFGLRHSQLELCASGAAIEVFVIALLLVFPSLFFNKTGTILKLQYNVKS